ncbi:MAG TPA: cytochrome c [Gemmatimonadales bacterium]|nr:cytochrome c [Gemmatimonadales bacterium]
MSERRAARRRGTGAAVAALGAALLLAAGATGCTTLDNAIAKVPWFTTMQQQVAVRPFEAGALADSAQRMPPPGAVPVTGLEDSLDILTELKNVANPVPRTSASLARGQLLYDTYCIVCHGPAGHSDGTVVPKFVPPPDITQPTTQQRSDGYIYAMIKQGRGIMPKYGDKIRSPWDRWSVVNYVRKLQGMP